MECEERDGVWIFHARDNYYLNNTRAPNQFIADIVAEALYAEELGMHSVWIGSITSAHSACCPARI